MSDIMLVCYHQLVAIFILYVLVFFHQDYCWQCAHVFLDLQIEFWHRCCLCGACCFLPPVPAQVQLTKHFWRHLLIWLVAIFCKFVFMKKTAVQAHPAR